MTDQSEALWIPNSNAFVGRGGLKPHYVILHGTAGGTRAQEIANYFASTQGSTNPVSATYVIGTDGTIAQCNSEADGAWANGVFSNGHDSWWDTQVNPNNTTISIEHCKPSSDNSDTLTPSQQDASFKLIHDICQRWDIPMRLADANGGITGHFSIDPVNRERCPGDYPWNELWSFLSGNGGENTVLQLTDSVVAQYFTDGGNGAWKCKTNGCVLMGANLTFYRSNNGLALFGLPTSNEIRLPQYPGTAIVPCQRAIFVWDPNHTIDNPPIAGPCYLLHINGGIGQQMIAEPLIASLQTAITTLQNQIAQANQTPSAQALAFIAQCKAHAGDLANLIAEVEKL